MVGSDRIALRRLFLAFVLDGAGGGRQQGKLFVRDQNCPPAGGDIQETQGTAIAAVVTLDVGDLQCRQDST